MARHIRQVARETVAVGTDHPHKPRPVLYKGDKNGN